MRKRSGMPKVCLEFSLEFAASNLALITSTDDAQYINFPRANSLCRFQRPLAENQDIRRTTPSKTPLISLAILPLIRPLQTIQPLEKLSAIASILLRYFRHVGHIKERSDAGVVFDDAFGVLVVGAFGHERGLLARRAGCVC
jgi:hypothetical protein